MNRSVEKNPVDGRTPEGSEAPSERDQPGFRFWSREFAPDAVLEAAEKYRRLVAAVDLPEPAQTRALRSAAARWPGCLAEAQRSSRATYLARAAAVASAERETAAGRVRTRAVWRSRGLEAAALWWDFHGLVAEIQAWRAERGPSVTRSDVAAFVRFAERRRSDPDTTHAAPLPDVWAWPATADGLGEGPVGSGLARRWLVFSADVSPDALLGAG